jgi:hypothetical protein
MMHYTRDKWSELLNEKVNEEEKIKMEDHLLSCEECFKLYLEELEDAECSEAMPLISKDFIDSIMEEIEDQHQHSSRVKFLRNKKRVFIYYTTAACITLLLMGNGTFRLALSAIPSTTAALVKSPIKLEASIEKFKFNDFISNNFKANNISKGTE